ncbi:MAG: glycosyl hydrolase family 28-related protein [Anaeromyxobacter sp.]
MIGAAVLTLFLVSPIVKLPVTVCGAVPYCKLEAGRGEQGRGRSGPPPRTQSRSPVPKGSRGALPEDANGRTGLDDPWRGSDATQPASQLPDDGWALQGTFAVKGVVSHSIPRVQFVPVARVGGDSTPDALDASTGELARPIGSGIDVRSLGARGNGEADDTSPIQEAINAASFSPTKIVYIPAGTYRYERLYLFHDPELNPGFNQERSGEITLQGEGISPENGGTGGTVLRTRVRSGSGLIVSPQRADATPYAARDFTARGISFEGATDGFLVEAAGVPSARFVECQFVQENAAGSALYLSTAYFGALEHCRFRNTATGVKTGAAVQFGTSAFAGLFRIADSNIAGYAYGLRHTTGGWQNMTIRSSEVVGSRYGVFVEANASIDLLTLDDVYFEGEATSFVAEAPGAQRIRNLIVNGLWALGASLTGPAIALNAPNSNRAPGHQRPGSGHALSPHRRSSGGRAGRVHGVQRELPEDARSGGARRPLHGHHPGHQRRGLRERRSPRCALRAERAAHRVPVELRRKLADHHRAPEPLTPGDLP